MARVAVIASGVILLVSTACASTTSTSSSVPSAAVEHEISVDVTTKAGEAPDSVSCPKDLPAEKGSSMRCVISTHGVRIDATARFVSIEDGRPQVDYVAGRTLPGSSDAMASATLQSKLSRDYVSRTGNALTSITCLPIAARAGATSHCVLVPKLDGKRHLTTVRVSSAPGGNLHLSYDVEDQPM